MILIVDDMAIIREPIAACLRAAGFETVFASDGREALGMLRRRRPKLILLDVAMPQMNGLELLQVIRGDPQLASIPVILLTAVTDRSTVVLASKLGVQGYLLKSRFSVGALMERVRTVLGAPEGMKISAAGSASCTAETSKAASAPAAAEQKPACAPAPQKSPDEIPALLDREKCIERAQKAMNVKTLSGVVAQVMALASSPRGDAAQLSTLISRDPSLAARVLSSANSAAFSSHGGVVISVPDAVRKMGFTNVRNITAACGIFDAMPPTSADGFNPIRCWQHCFAVAQLCETIELAQRTDPSPLAYVVGLCHELAEIILRTHFAAEYAQVMQWQQRTGLSRGEVERRMLGMTTQQLILTIVRSIGLPDSIREPIEMYCRGTFTSGDSDRRRLAQVLRIADHYANALMLASGTEAPIAPVLHAETGLVLDDAVLQRPDGDQLRSEILAVTAMLARLPHAEEAQLMRPMFTRGSTRIALVREGTFSAFDPIHAALQSMAEVELLKEIPQPATAMNYDGLVLVTKSSRLPANKAEAIQAMRRVHSGRDNAILWLVHQHESGAAQDGLQPVACPMTLGSLSEFVQGRAQLGREAQALAA